VFSLSETLGFLNGWLNPKKFKFNGSNYWEMDLNRYSETIFAVFYRDKPLS
jgi:hypothetical protein